MEKIIDGKKLAKEIKDKIVKEIVKLKGERPNLAIILVGERADSLVYVDRKIEEAKKVGIDTHLYKCSANIEEREIFELINYLNYDVLVDAIIVQLPLLKGFDTDGIILALNPEKDADCFHPKNVEAVIKDYKSLKVVSPVFASIFYILKDINFNLQNKSICVISNSKIFGHSLASAFKQGGAKVENIRPDDKQLAKKTKQADILISVAGKKKFIKKDMVKKDAVVIDVGITKEGKKIYGDIDFAGVKDKASFITPVPGGVGPMTIAMLFKNTLELYKKRRGK
ncbi:bifunctional methylenetetrahydrofolate dehydrogenase/methenyltetrahydrofolate cyclohydrolase [Candidatus Falkowbacteria bacterium]|nr:MAG: bifunctional methylenetetrahydrofolate dehydrogenase/methenyltetrahydrofolate cyclohydrolase [Candidatus Falkowbacteria bacterium]